MSIEKFLDISTAHITKHDGDCLNKMHKALKSGDTRPHPRVIPHEYGWMINLQYEPDVYADHLVALVGFGFTGAFMKVFEYAHSKGCIWINFDQDGPEDLVNFKEYIW